MKLLLAKSNFVTAQKIKKLNLVTFFILSSILLGILLIVQLPKSKEILLSPSTANHFLNVSTNQQSIVSNLIIPGILIVAIVFISLFQLGIFTRYVPKSLNEIITSKSFTFESNKLDITKEIGYIDLGGATIEIRWVDYSGQFKNWKFLIMIKIQDVSKIETFSKLAKLLLMENDPDERLFYKKSIYVKDWPRQEYLIEYWLKG